MPTILIDITFISNELKRKRPPHGIPRVILAYLHHYIDTMQLVYQIKGRLFILPQTISKEIAQLLFLWDANSYKKVLWLLIKGIYSSYRNKSKETYYLIKLDLNGIKYPRYFKSTNQLGIKTILMVHDLFPIIYPEYSDPAYAQQFEQHMITCLKEASAVICVSQSTAQFLGDFLQSKALPCPPVLAAPLASGLSVNLTKGQNPIGSPYFVMVSTMVSRKNHLLLLHIWRHLVNKLGPDAPKLVLIGKRSAECSSTLAMLNQCKQLKQVLIETQAQDKELANFLYHAQALLFPTFAEGYGLPLMEALSLKVPVIASELPIFHEIAGDVPDYLDPIDGLGWMALIEEYMQPHSLKRQAQFERLSKFSPPTWEAHFKRVDDFILSIQ